MAHTPKHRLRESDATIELPADATIELSSAPGWPAGGPGADPVEADGLADGFPLEEAFVAGELRHQDHGDADDAERDDPEQRGRSGGRGSRAVRTVFRTSGELLITLGVVVLLFVGYQLYGRTGMINDHQRDLDRQLAQAWAAPRPSQPPPAAAAPGGSAVAAPPPGDSIGRLYIPKLHLQWVVVEGVGLDDLQYAPGHYPGTALPGQVGNFAMAGHRERGIFWDLDQVDPGDLLIMETATNWYVYQVFQNHIVTPHSVEVVAPTPNRPGVAPTQADITLTTCNPKWDNYQRMVVHGALARTTTHDVRPPELGS